MWLIPTQGSGFILFLQNSAFSLGKSFFYFRRKNLWSFHLFHDIAKAIEKNRNGKKKKKGVTFEMKKLTEQLYESVEEIWNEYYIHPFIKGIGEGKLELDKFRFYMVQDYLYLLDYAKVFALGIVKSKEERLMRKFASMVNNTLNSEMKIHKTYMERLGITKGEVEKTPVSLANQSYTSYMLSVGNQEGVLELLVSILACSWSYQKIGIYLAKAYPKSVEHEFYGDWVKGYCSKEYEKDNEEILALVDELGEAYTKEQIENLKKIFINCSRYEAMFWEMAYKKEL